MTMTGRSALVVCMVLISVGMALPTNALAESGEDIVIESDMTWEQDMILSKNVRIINGGSLTFSSTEVTLEKGVDIFVDSSSSISMDHSQLVAAEPPSGVVGYGYCDEDNRSAVLIPWNEPNKPFDAIIRAIEPGSLDGVTAYIGDDSVAMSGTEYTLSFDSGTNDVWIDLVGPLCYPVSISEVNLRTSSDSNYANYNAADLEYVNMMVHGDPGFTVRVDGSMESTDSTIMGGQISATGILSINDTALDRVGPVVLTSDDATISLGGNTDFTNSTDDHDVRARAHSSIEWGEDVSGSGGLTDKWERRIAGQHLRFEARYVTYEITGMHSPPSYSNFSDENGVSYVKGGDERVVEIAWSDDNSWEDGPIWTEQAVVTIQNYRTAWNPENSEIGNYGGGGFSLTWQAEIIVDQATPNIQWTSLRGVRDGNSTYTATLGESLAMEAVIANTGTAAAILAIDCNVTSTGIASEMSPIWPNAMIGAGGEETIHFSWRTSTTGKDSLTCRVLTPTQLVDDLSFGGGEITSGAITWEKAGEEEGLPYILPIMLALVVGIAIAGFVAVNRMSEIDEENRALK
jgi:hypothetical protein